ncbi:hypothetical protein GO009_02510 [Muricauda sp. TY007]|uniref:hypothetical protein n=1 Tax=Allomuricauda sp. TY007 TaxID=2683200 RepID=UPI0013BF16D0|nr:hypothetical protein [Muricauda sp. TY007]NDV14885.1 hypothetical protein [Muricauda sp. TY007]
MSFRTDQREREKSCPKRDFSSLRSLEMTKIIKKTDSLSFLQKQESIHLDYGELSILNEEKMSFRTDQREREKSKR